MRRWMKLAGLLLCLGTALVVAPRRADAVIAQQNTWTFVGDCTDCAGTGVGYLVLQNYVPGSQLLISNFVSFDYSSNLVPSFHKTAADLGNIQGILTLPPGGDTLFMAFNSDTVEFNAGRFAPGWCIGVGGSAANCTNTTDLGATFAITAGIPEPASLALLGAGLAGLGAIRRRRGTI